MSTPHTASMSVPEAGALAGTVEYYVGDPGTSSWPVFRRDTRGYITYISCSPDALGAQRFADILNEYERRAQR